MYNEDTRRAYGQIIDYIEGKYDSIKDNEDFRNKFQELLESDEEFQIMINKFNNVNVYNEDKITSVDDFLALGEKIYPAKEEIETIDELIAELKKLNPNETFERVNEYNEREINSSISMNDPKLKLPEGFYYNEKNGLTNKHNTRSGRYVMFRVNKIAKKNDTMDKSETLKDSNSPKKVTESKMNTSNLPSVPFYKKAINFVNSMPDIVKIANGASLAVFGTLTVFNAIGGGGLFYVGAVLGLPIPAITATVYAGRAIYKLYKSGKIRQLLNRNKKTLDLQSNDESLELAKSKAEENINKKVIMPFGADMDLAEKEKSKVEVDSKKDESIREPKEVPKEESIRELKEVPKVPVLEKPKREPLPIRGEVKASEPNIVEQVKKEEPNVEVPVVKPTYPIKDDSYYSNEYDEPVDNVTFDPSDFDSIPKKVETSETEAKADKPIVGRHVKKNMQNLDEVDKENRITKLESEIAKANEDIKEANFWLDTMNKKPIFEEDESRKQAANEVIARYEAQKEEATTKLSNMKKELNDLKGVKEEKDLYTLLSTRYASLSRKLKSLPDTPENKEIRDRISATKGQIKKYMDLTKLQKNNPYVTEEDKKKLTQIENIAYTTTEYVWDELYGTGTKRSRRGK